MSAIRKENIDIVKLLLEYGADPHAEGDDGHTVLHSASSYGNVEMLRLFIDLGVNHNVMSCSYGLPLHRAMCWGNYDNVKLLLELHAEEECIKAFESFNSREISTVEYCRDIDNIRSSFRILIQEAKPDIRLN